MLTHITTSNVLAYLASKTKNKTFKITPNELSEFAHLVERQDSSYRWEDGSSDGMMSALINMYQWYPLMVRIYYKNERYFPYIPGLWPQKPPISDWDKLEICTDDDRWDDFLNRYILTGEIENFDKAYEAYNKENLKK